MGKCNPVNALSVGIILLGRVLPHYISEDDAIDSNEKYVDELPEITLSDRLPAGAAKSPARSRCQGGLIGRHIDSLEASRVVRI
jgi:hypothetical protein